MKTLTFKAEDRLDDWLAKEARARRVSKSQIVREALLDRMRGTGTKSCYDLSADLCGSLKGPRDLSYGKRHLKGFGRIVTVTLLDTGPLVAVLNEKDHYHQWALDNWRTLTPPLRTCEAVVVEAIFRLEGSRLSLEGMWEMFRRKIVEVDFELSGEIDAVAGLMRRYQNLPMDLADACLVRMAEKRRDTRVFTIDRDFKIYRRHGRQVIPLIFPD